MALFCLWGGLNAQISYGGTWFCSNYACSLWLRIKSKYLGRSMTVVSTLIIGFIWNLFGWTIRNFRLLLIIYFECCKDGSLELHQIALHFFWWTKNIIIQFSIHFFAICHITCFCFLLFGCSLAIEYWWLIDERYLLFVFGGKHTHLEYFWIKQYRIFFICGASSQLLEVGLWLWVIEGIERFDVFENELMFLFVFLALALTLHLKIIYTLTCIQSNG